VSTRPKPSGKVLARDVSAWFGEAEGRSFRRAFERDLGREPEPDVQWIGEVELARHAFGSPLEAGIFLQLVRGPWLHDRLMLYTEIPWLPRVADAEAVIKGLLGWRWAVLRCGSPGEADGLCRAVESKFVRAIRLGRGTGRF
jgi:hypothetical protein